MRDYWCQCGVFLQSCKLEVYGDGFFSDDRVSCRDHSLSYLETVGDEFVDIVDIKDDVFWFYLEQSMVIFF